jgi:uncharacterized membrane protein YukC
MDEAIERINPRAFKLRDRRILNLAMVQATEVVNSLEEIAETENTELSNMKPASLPSESLYILASAYLDIYNALLEEDLIKSGNPKSYQYTLH